MCERYDKTHRTSRLTPRIMWSFSVELPRKQGSETDL